MEFRRILRLRVEGVPSVCLWCWKGQADLIERNSTRLRSSSRSIARHYWRGGMNSLAVELQARAGRVTVSEEALTVDLVDGRTILVPLGWYPRLWYGAPEERNHFEIFGEGAYIHWPDLDEDLTVVGLLAGRRSGESPRSLKKWLEARQTKKQNSKALAPRAAGAGGAPGDLGPPPRNA